ncbi:YqjF family protein [Fluviicola chungangensis]|uniref:DUF2071 domain-containing protein n=1 Tax=Fluviicola chungangensis TaxID=2597671 RepID=A0A556N388_9FLAO|nr:DUF2071 domain-containing protein [Fluviicola chungangensis]TSJ46621.1 DUF2071 domain-containing protein [Fluviicola chungangensis]
MNKTAKERLFQSVSHRPWPIPTKSWSYYQEWNHALFLHWKVEPGLLEPFIPKGLELDTYEGEAWISLVAFTMEKIRPKNLPAFSPVSNFHEINIRTYVTHNNKPGVYFLNIEAQKLVSAKLSKLLSGLPYEKAKMIRIQKNIFQEYTSNLKKKGFRFSAKYTVSNKPVPKTELDLWLTERYCLYLDRGLKTYMYEIHHLPWELLEVEMNEIQTTYRFGEIDLKNKPDRVHYSPGVKVLAWKKEKLL